VRSAKLNQIPLFRSMGIKVLVRVRPFEAQEAGVCLDAQERRSNANQAIAWIGADGRQTEYEFDRIFTENCSQHDVFEVRLCV